MGEKGPKALGLMKFSEIAVDWLGCHQRRKFLNRTGSSASYVDGSSKSSGCWMLSADVDCWSYLLDVDVRCWGFDAGVVFSLFTNGSDAWVCTVMGV